MEGTTGPNPCGLFDMSLMGNGGTPVSAAASAACECCGKPCNGGVFEMDNGAYEQKLKSIKQTVQHTKDKHAEFLQTEKGKCWLAQMNVIIKRMEANIDELRQVHFHEDDECKQDRRQRKAANRRLLQEYVQAKVKEELQRGHAHFDKLISKTKKDEFCSNHCTYCDRVKMQRQESLTQIMEECGVPDAAKEECAAFMRKHGFDRNRAKERESIVDTAWVHKHFPERKADADAEDKTTITDNVVSASDNVNKMPMAPPNQSKAKQERIKDRFLQAKVNLMLEEQELKAIKDEIIEDGTDSEPVTKRQKIELSQKQLDEAELELDNDLERIRIAKASFDKACMDQSLRLKQIGAELVSHQQLDGAAAAAAGAAS